MKLTVLKKGSLNSHDFNKVKLKLKKLRKSVQVKFWWVYHYNFSILNERTNEWMNEWTNERTNDWMNERMNEWMNERTNEWMNECGKTIFKMRDY